MQRDLPAGNHVLLSAVRPLGGRTSETPGFEGPIAPLLAPACCGTTIRPAPPAGDCGAFLSLHAERRWRITNEFGKWVETSRHVRGASRALQTRGAHDQHDGVKDPAAMTTDFQRSRPASTQGATSKAPSSSDAARSRVVCVVLKGKSWHPDLSGHEA